MKRLLCCILLLSLLMPCAALAEMDNDALKNAEDMSVFLDRGNVNTIVRPSEGQPILGVCDDEDIELIGYLDYVILPEHHATLVRLTLSTISREELYASELRLSIGGKTYIFPVYAAVDEYDVVFYEDYSVFFTDESLPLLKAAAKSKDGVLKGRLAGEREYGFALSISPDLAAQVYDLYVDAGGMKQELVYLREDFPVTVVKEK